MISSDVSEDTIRRIVREEIEAALKKDPATRKAAIIASKGTLDWLSGEGEEQKNLGGALIPGGGPP